MSFSLDPRHPTVRPLEPLDYEPIRLLMEVEYEDEAPGPLRQMRISGCQKEPWTREWLEQIPEGGVFYDVGANVGSYTLIAAARGIQTVAFEPVPENSSTLSRNLMWNGLEDRVIVVPQGLASGAGLAWCNLVDPRPGSASHKWGDLPVVKRPGTARHRLPLMVNALDTLVGMYRLPAPTHIKIDVDGWEGQVLAGMPQVLASPQLQGIMIELGRETEEALVAQLGAAGWALAERWDPENRNIAYGEFRRVAAAEAEPVKVRKPRARSQRRAA